MIEHTLTNNASILRNTSVVGSISLSKSFGEMITPSALAGVDLIELRLDLYSANCIPPGLEFGAPLLVTARCAEEGGGNGLSAKERADLIRPWLDKAAMVDLEIRSLQEMSELVTEIKASPALLLASYHDFNGTPPFEILAESMWTAAAAGADAVKFATTLRGAEDLATLTRLFAIPGRPPLSVMGMGPLGKVSRLLFARLGSILNYGYLDAATVAGQWEARRLREILQEI